MISKIILLIIALGLSSLSCLGVSEGIRYRSLLDEISADNPGFAFLKLKDYLRENPQSIYARDIKFALCEYYLQSLDYRDAIPKLTEYLKEYPQGKSSIFAKALLYNALSEYKDNPELTEKIKTSLFSKSLFLIFSESKSIAYRSLLKNRYKIVNYINRTEIFKNNDLILKIAP